MFRSSFLSFGSAASLPASQFTLTSKSCSIKVVLRRNSSIADHILPQKILPSDSVADFVDKHAPSLTKDASKNPLSEYDRLVKIGRLKNDEYQREIISNLSSLHSSLINYTPPKINIPDISVRNSKFNFKLKNPFSFLLKNKNSDNQNVTSQDQSNIPPGIYLYGDVGCGKTMLMDLFYSTIPIHLSKKRIHFHQFMQNLHKRSHQIIKKHGSNDFDTIPILSAEIAQSATVLCFDEFQVTDVADAMLLRRVLLRTLRPDHGLILFATSNRAPDDLYINGIQRQSFIPCIKLIKNRTSVIYLNSPTDYRKIPRPVSNVYWYPKPGVSYESSAAKGQAQKHVDEWYDYFTQGHPPEHNVELTIWGRKLIVPKSSPPNVAQFTFEELCARPLSAGDYLTLAQNFTSFIITDIPYLSIDVRDKVRRFITFLDAVYDNNGRIAVTAVAPFDDLFVEPELVDSYGFKLKKSEIEAKEETLDEDLDNDILVKKHGFDKKIAKKAAFFAVDEERFAFARALSRLHQMSTTDWVEKERVH
ncbi:Afg1p ASCRUDRAFT_77362 [Ascoidea rubescens DSM 1968]|uniref:AFG1-like ATPase n=1 Tax=Ascoidea rubescens DSM 1968 TaxID=1344418 RepID=A0A1D2VCE3_9ASCO|nr:hypothetical protein ASCRUDRAFT_77362 [Ascoidea rubescens DSM 1968]ODV59301.1 hypothetical protein ASCRUDRAFT_77362 [Ascoidea rubescens DSM 1968]